VAKLFIQRLSARNRLLAHKRPEAALRHFLTFTLNGS
jgi:hypothetical protein